MAPNFDRDTVAGFGDEWRRFDQSALSEAERRTRFEQYFAIFPWAALPPHAIGADIGCGSGRWAKLVAPRIDRLICVDASAEALDVARRNLAGETNCEFVHASLDAMPIAGAKLDFAYSLGVLHHVPDTLGGIKACVAKLKPGAPLLVYLYYALDNRPSWFRALWRLSDGLRRAICRLPFGARNLVAEGIAALVYFPLARSASVLAILGLKVDNLPLSAYRRLSYYSMRTDARDRFGTSVEQRFTRAQIHAMLIAAGLERITFSEQVPFWTVLGYRKA